MLTAHDRTGGLPGMGVYHRIKQVLAPVWHRLPDTRLRRWLVTVKTRSHSITRPGIRWVPVERLYHGASLLFSAEQVGELLGDPTWHLTRLVDGAQVDLYSRFAAGRTVPGPGERLEDVPYAEWARKQIDAGLTCMGRDDPSEIPGIIAERRRLWDADAAGGRVPWVDLAVVRRIRGTDDYEVADGDHRIARAWVHGRRWVRVRVTWRTVPAAAGHLAGRSAGFGVGGPGR